MSLLPVYGPGCLSLAFSKSTRLPRVPREKMVTALAKIFGLYQSRSAACPLHVAIETPRRFDPQSIYHDEGANRMAELDEFLLQYSGTIAGLTEHLKTLDITCAPQFLEQIHELLSARSSNVFPLLEKITVNLRNSWQITEGIIGPLQLFSAAPKLRHVDRKSVV